MSIKEDDMSIQRGKEIHKANGEERQLVLYQLFFFIHTHTVPSSSLSHTLTIPLFSTGNVHSTLSSLLPSPTLDSFPPPCSCPSQQNKKATHTNLASLPLPFNPLCFNPLCFNPFTLPSPPPPSPPLSTPLPPPPPPLSTPTSLH